MEQVDTRLAQRVVNQDGTIIVSDDAFTPGDNVFVVRVDEMELRVADTMATLITFGSTRPLDSYHGWYRQMSAFLDVLELPPRGDLGNHNMDDWLYDENGLPC